MVEISLAMNVRNGLGLCLLWFLLLRCDAFGKPRDESPLPAKPVNLNFELGSPGTVPPGWEQPHDDAADDFEALTTEDDPRSGRYCAVLRSKRATKRSATLTQRISALPFRTRRIRLSAWARVTVPPKPASQAQLWLRIDRPGGVGFVDEMSDRPILSKEWKRYEIVGDVDADATRINFGARFTREGAIWLDDVALEVIPNVKVRNEAPRALNRQQ